MASDWTSLAFDDVVRRRKAAEWLVANDPIVKAAFEISRYDPIGGLLSFVGFADDFQIRIEKTMLRMEVTEDDREYGYPRRVGAPRRYDGEPKLNELAE